DYLALPTFPTRRSSDLGRINAYNALLAAKNITVSPQAKFIVSSNEIYVGQAVTFSSQSLGNDLQYEWTFNGGSPSAANTKSATRSEEHTSELQSRENLV